MSEYTKALVERPIEDCRRLLFDHWKDKGDDTLCNFIIFHSVYDGIAETIGAYEQEIAYHRAQDGLLSAAQQQVGDLREQLASATQPLEPEMARLNERLIAANARIAELERALAAAEAREREAYERAAKVCDKVYDEAAGWLKEHPTTREYGEAMAYGVCEGTHDCAIAIRALAKERT